MPTIPSRVQASQYGGLNPAGRRRAVPPRIILQKGPAQGLEQTKDRQVNRVQQAVLQATQAIKSLPFGAGNLIEGLSLTSGANTVNHGLPQAWRGALLCTPSASVTWHVASSAPAGASPATQAKFNAQTLVVTVSGDLTADLWVW